VIERDAILGSLRAALPDLKQRWPIRSLGLFGSFARGDAGDDSDIDVLVEFEHPVGLSAFLGLESELHSLLSRRVDLVSRAALKPHMGREVMRDLVPL
jgi:predicted nucleotidyltransferase